MSSRLVVLGGCGAWPEPGRACSGFVLEHQGFRVVLDLGYGTLPRLLTLLASVVGDGIDAVVVTHAHPDHMVDLHGLFRARWFGHRDAPAIPLYCPEQVVSRVAGLEEDDAEAVRAVFDWHPLPDAPYTVGPWQLDSMSLPHFILNAGVRLSAPGLTVAYTGDTGPSPLLAELGKDADLFIVEASDRGQAEPASPRMHLTSTEAGEAATAAGAERLMLTHFWPGNDRAAQVAKAAETFAGPILVADEGTVVPLH